MCSGVVMNRMIKFQHNVAKQNSRISWDLVVAFLDRDKFWNLFRSKQNCFRKCLYLDKRANHFNFLNKNLETLAKKKKKKWPDGMFMQYSVKWDWKQGMKIVNRNLGEIIHKNERTWCCYYERMSLSCDIWWYWRRKKQWHAKVTEAWKSQFQVWVMRVNANLFPGVSWSREPVGAPGQLLCFPH